jgi:DNA-binding transcriptional MerR regulator
MTQGVAIGEAARQSGVKVPTIRYYEQIGLLPAPTRSESNRRNYEDSDLRRLMFIRHARDLGFEVEAIRELLVMNARPEQSCAEADAIAKRHLGEVKRRIDQLQALQAELERMVEECGHGRICECRVIQVLADHAQCRHH